MATALSPRRLRPTPGVRSPRSSRGRTKVWWMPPQASATSTRPILTSRICPYDVVQRSETTGRRSIATIVPAITSTATSPTAIREKRRKAVRRRSGASGQTTTASVSTPPTHSIAVTRCTQSATSPTSDAFGSVAWWPESG